MASLRDVVSEYQDDLRNGIAWLAFWREGRSWQAEAFHLDLDDTLYPEDRARLAEIQTADPRAIVVNGYYSGYLSEEMSVAELAAGVRHHYDNGLNNIAPFMEAHSDELPPDVLEAAREKAHAAGLPFYERPYRGDDIDPYSYDGHMSIEDYELMQKLMEQDRERSEPMSEVFSILLHNRQRYEQGKEGLWFSLPTTTEKLQEALREIGISADNPQDFFLYDYRSPQERPINLTEYFAVMTGAVKSGISIPVPILALITTFLAATIVYGVFYTKITKNIQMFGQLRTIGMTKLQIKRMARKEGRIYALEGIPVGLLAGLIIGYVGCPDGFHIKTALIYAVLIAVMAYIAVNIALFKPVRVAMNTSPVEGAKYLIYAGKTKISHKLHRKLNLLNLAKINIHRNRKKAILTLMMLGLSGAILITTATVAGSINPEKQARFKYFPSGDIHIQLKNTIGSSFDKESEPYGSSKIQLEDNPLESQALLQALSNIDGVEKITPSNSIYMTITFPGGSGSITSISAFFPVLNREQLTQVQAVLSSGIADYDKMSAENGILVAEGTAKTGDLLRIMGRSPDGSNFDIEAAVVGTYKRNELMESAPVVPGSPYFIMTYDTAQKLTGITAQTGVLSLEVQEEKWQDVLLSVQEIAEKNEKIEVNTIEQVMLSIQKYYEPSIQMFYMISAILFVFGSISLMNMLIVDFQSRKREIGLFEAIGTTQRQMKTILSTEIRIYLFSSLAISIIVGAILSLFVSAWLDSANHCISLALPWPFLLSLIIVHFVIYFVFALYAGSELRKTSILSAIRE